MEYKYNTILTSSLDIYRLQLSMGNLGSLCPLSVAKRILKQLQGSYERSTFDKYIYVTNR